MVPPEVFDAICALPDDWQAAGSLNAAVLRGFLRHLPRPLEHSLETGAGKSTLLFSHCSRHHLVFARDWNFPSVAKVRADGLFRPGPVEFIEGSTQQTLPRHVFTHSLGAALIDGPHAWPFPQLEYFFIYPHLVAGALLAVYDIHIPTIRGMYDFLREDDMFTELEVIGHTAFFRRTAAPTFDPYGDGLDRQAYNLRRVTGYDAVMQAGTLWGR